MTVIGDMWDKMGFIIRCIKCGSDQIVIDNTLGYSPESGAWGSIDLKCNKCSHQAEIYEP